MTEESDYCEALVRDADKDRFLATLFAPAASRPNLYALYAFDVETSAVAHRVRDPSAGEIRLQWWEDALSSEHGVAGHPVAEAVASVLREHGIALSVAIALIDARRRALFPEADRSEAEFELSAAETSGAIFLMAAQVLSGMPGDATRLAAHHAGVAAAAAAPVEPARLAFDLKTVATRHRDAVRALIPSLPEAALPAFLPLVLQLDERASLPQWRKQWILWRASKNLARWV